MADSKIPDLTGLATLSPLDELYVVDKSDTTDSADGTSKKHAVGIESTFVGTTDTQTLTNKSIVGYLKVVTVGFSLECNYVCDGTADDVQIQEALNYVDAAGGGTVVIKAGTYDLQNVLVIGDDITLEGEGIGATYLKVGDHVWENLTTNPYLPAGGTSYRKGFILTKHDALGNGIGSTTYAQRITLRDFTLDVNAANQTLSFDPDNLVCGGIILYPIFLGLVERVEILNASWAGICLWGANSPFFDVRSPNRVLNCRVDTCGIGQTEVDVLAGILVDNQSIENTLVMGNHVSNCSNYTAGIMTEDSNTVLICNNTIYNCYTGISLGSARKCLVSGNQIDTTEVDGITFSGDCAWTDIDGNYILNAGVNGLKVPGLGSVKNNHILFAGDNGIKVSGSTTFTIKNNEIYDCGQDTEATTRAGLYIDITDAATNNATVSDNFIIDDYVFANNPSGVQTMQYGILIGGAARTLSTFNLTNNITKYCVTDIDISDVTWDTDCFVYHAGETLTGFGSYGSFSAWSPSITWVGDAAPSGATTTARHADVGNICFFRFKQVNTSAGTNNTQINFTLPHTPVGDAGAYNYVVSAMGSTLADISSPDTAPTKAVLYGTTGARVYVSFAAFAAKCVWVNGWFEF